MSEQEDRRASQRVLTVYTVVLEDEEGVLLDDRALAHDLSEKGFRLECLPGLEAGQRVRFRLSLESHGEVNGRARIVWAERTDLAQWAGAEFLDVSWRDRRILRKAMNIAGVDWDKIVDNAWIAVLTIAGVVALWEISTRPLLRGALLDSVPKAAATLIAVWALVELLRPER